MFLACIYIFFGKVCVCVMHTGIHYPFNGNVLVCLFEKEHSTQDRNKERRREFAAFMGFYARLLGWSDGGDFSIKKPTCDNDGVGMTSDKPVQRNKSGVFSPFHFHQLAK